MADVLDPSDAIDNDGADLYFLGVSLTSPDARFIWSDDDDVSLTDELIDLSADKSEKWRPFDHLVLTDEEIKSHVAEIHAELEAEGYNPASSEFENAAWDRLFSGGELRVTGQGTFHWQGARLQFIAGPDMGIYEPGSFLMAVEQTLWDDYNKGKTVYEEIGERVALRYEYDEMLDFNDMPWWIPDYIITSPDAPEVLLALEAETDTMIFNDVQLGPWEWRGTYMVGPEVGRESPYGFFFRMDEDDDIEIVVTQTSDPGTYEQLVELAISLGKAPESPYA